MDERIARQHLSPTFGDRRLADIRRCEVEDWLHRLASQGLAPATCNRILAVFKSICSLASLYGLLPVGQSPCVGVPPFQIHSQRGLYLFPEEARRLSRELERSGRQEATALRLLLLTGARKSEILKARWENVRLAQRAVVPLSGRCKPRHISLSDEAVKIIRLIPRVPGCPWVFPGYAPGKPLSDIYVFWNELRRRLDLADVRVHDLRHTLPVCWSMPGTRSTRCKSYWATVIPDDHALRPFGASLAGGGSRNRERFFLSGQPGNSDLLPLNRAEQATASAGRARPSLVRAMGKAEKNGKSSKSEDGDFFGRPRKVGASCASHSMIASRQMHCQ